MKQMWRRGLAGVAFCGLALMVYGCGGGGGGGGNPGGSLDSGTLGSMGVNILRASPYTNLVIEVDNAPGITPDATALSTLASIVGKYASKPGGVTFAGGNTIGMSLTSYTDAEIKAIETANRTQFTSGNTAAIYILYLNGTYAPNPDTVGLSYEATGYAVFKQRMASAAVPPATPAQLERSDLVHEFGHLLGLVEIDYTSPSPHQDLAHPFHCTHTDCAMYFAIETVTGGAVSVLPADYDSFCQADIAGLKSGAIATF